MLRYAFNATRVRVRSLPMTGLRNFTANAVLANKAHVDETLDQAASKAYKTVKEKDTKSARRDQLIWLVKHSHNKDPAAASKVSPHDLPWERVPAPKISVKKEGEWEGVTVWPHLW